MQLNTRWILIGAAATAGLVAVSLLPPRACDPDDRQGPTLSTCAFGWRNGSPQDALVRRARGRYAEALQRRQLADSLVQGAGVRSVRAGPVAVYYEPPMNADSARRWLDLVTRELALIPGQGRGRAVALVLFSDPARPELGDQGQSEVARQSSLMPLDRFATGAHGGMCVVSYRLRNGTNHLLRQQRPAVLDWCALHARYGEPGPAVARWAERAVVYAWRDHASLAEMVQAPDTAPRWNADDHRARACLAGAAAPCLQFLGVGQQGSWYWFREPTRALLAWLLVNSEPGQFARFWRSQRPVGEALEEAYGRPSGEVLQAWARTRYQLRPRARTGPTVLLAGAVWFSLAMVAAFVAMQRRQVG